MTSKETKELKQIREELKEAVDNKDILYVKMQINKIDSLLHKSNKIH